MIDWNDVCTLDEFRRMKTPKLYGNEFEKTVSEGYELYACPSLEEIRLPDLMVLLKTISSVTLAPEDDLIGLTYTNGSWEYEVYRGYGVCGGLAVECREAEKHDVVVHAHPTENAHWFLPDDFDFMVRRQDRPLCYVGVQFDCWPIRSVTVVRAIGGALEFKICEDRLEKLPRPEPLEMVVYIVQQDADAPRTS